MKLTKLILMVLLLMILGPLVTWGETLKGKVVAVKDGDTLVILSDKKVQNKIRLAEIDAPEKNQAFGETSKESLSGLVFGKEVSVEKVDVDKYGRVVGKVYLDKVNINTEQVKRGLAWVYTHYNKNNELVPLEAEARRKKIGLWADKDPTPPWQWRKEEKTHRTAGQKLEKRPGLLNKLFAKISGKGFTCAGKRFCKEMTSCEEATFYLKNCGTKTIDGNNDGVPCEKLCVKNIKMH